jgi:hypothetical protein
VLGPRLRRWAPEHVLQDELASALARRSALGLQEGTDIRELVVRVLPGILLLQPFEALHHGQAQELERIEGGAGGVTGGKPGLHQVELTIRRKQRVQTRLIVVKRHRETPCSDVVMPLTVVFQTWI